MIVFAIWEGPNSGKQKPPHKAIFQSLADELRQINFEGMNRLLHFPLSYNLNGRFRQVN